jgi:hypothetical protein
MKPDKRKGELPDVLFLNEGKRAIPGIWKDTKPYMKGDKTEADYYVWLWEGDQTMSNFMTGLLIVAFLLITCYPVWPDILKLIV